MYYQSDKKFVFSGPFFSTGIFEASPFNFSVLQKHFSQLAYSHQYSFPMFTEVCGLTWNKQNQSQQPPTMTNKKQHKTNHWTNDWGKYIYDQRNNAEIRPLKVQKS